MKPFLNGSNGTCKFQLFHRDYRTPNTDHELESFSNIKIIYFYTVIHITTKYIVKEIKIPLKNVGIHLILSV